MLSRNEMKRRQERVLALLRQEGCGMRMVKIAYGSGLTYDTVRPVLVALAKAGLIARQSDERNTTWELVGLSERERVERLEALERKKAEHERATIKRGCRREGIDADEHQAWLDRVAHQKAWRKQMAALENQR
jgi:predicted transcriptional regulator